MDTLSALKTFLRVAETGSFTVAAECRGETRSAVTRAVQGLEKEFGVTLFHRTTRTVTLTHEGRILMARARRIIGEFSDLREELDVRTEKPVAGHIRISSSTVVAWALLQRQVFGFMRKNPGVAIDLLTEDRDVKLVQEGVDLAFKLGNVLDENVIAKRIGSVENVLCVSPEWAERNGCPQTVEELKGIDFVINDYLGRQMKLIHTASGETVRIPIRGRFASRNAMINYNACLNGGGPVMLPVSYAEEYFQSGKLVRLMPEWKGETYAFYALYRKRALSRAAREFLDFVTAGLEAEEGYLPFKPFEEALDLTADRADD